MSNHANLFQTRDDDMRHFLNCANKSITDKTRIKPPNDNRNLKQFSQSCDKDADTKISNVIYVYIFLSLKCYELEHEDCSNWIALLRLG